MKTSKGRGEGRNPSKGETTKRKKTEGKKAGEKEAKQEYFRSLCGPKSHPLQTFAILPLCIPCLTDRCLPDCLLLCTLTVSQMAAKWTNRLKRVYSVVLPTQRQGMMSNFKPCMQMRDMDLKELNLTENM